MLFSRWPPFLLFSALLLLLFVSSSSSHPSFEFSGRRGRDDGLVVLRRFAAEVSSYGNNGTFVLAAERTHRRDPLDGFKYYTGGWNISKDSHYWPSVGFSAAPLFVLAVAWFLCFALVLLLLCCYHFCCSRLSYSYSRTAYALSLILLIIFTCAAIAGCVALYTGQEKFHDSTVKTLNFIVSEANGTVSRLRSFSDILDAAQSIKVDNILLPSNIQQRIDEVQSKVNSSANLLSRKTTDNRDKINQGLDTVRLILVVVAAVMLALAFLGFLVSMCGLKFLVYVLVIIGWILVTGTLILCGVFLLLHNVVEDTCVAMNEWAGQPRAQTALDDILPCYDVATANQALNESKDVTFQLISVVNQVIVNVSNRNFPPGLAPLYYNQSGPLVPSLCNPYTADLNNHTCATGEVDFMNATQVWKGYVCQTAMVSGSEICASVGRLTPAIYSQMSTAVTVTRALYSDGPFLASLLDCSFVRETFTTIHKNNCPGLERNSNWTYIGLLMVSTAVMLSLIFWVIYAKERKHRKYNKQFIAQSQSHPQGLQGKRP